MNQKEITRLMKDPDLLIKRYFQNQKFCMAYDKNLCSDCIIDSHIISKKHMKNIQSGGHVYAVTPSAHHNSKQLYEFSLKGIGNVAHVKAFCEYHDNDLFKSFEKEQDFTGEYSQIYAISFRALAREYFQKICLLNVFNEFKNGDLRIIAKTKYIKSDDFNEKINSIKKSLRDLKFLYEKFKKYEKSGLKYILIETEKLPISATGILFPIYDISGKKIQNKKQLGFIYNMISLENKSFILIATVIKSFKNTHKYFLDPIYRLSDDEKINYLITYFFFTNDNIVVNPEWYDNLSAEFKHELGLLINSKIGEYNEIQKNQRLLNFSKITKASIAKTQLFI